MRFLLPLLLVYSTCFSGNKPDGEVVAVVEYTDTEFFRRVRRAWRANRATETFEQIPARGIKCKNEGFGT